MRSAGKRHTHTLVGLSESGEQTQIVTQKVSRSTTQRFAQSEGALTWLSHSEELGTQQLPLRATILQGCFFFFAFFPLLRSHQKDVREVEKREGSQKAMGMGFNYLALTFICGYMKRKVQLPVLQVFVCRSPTAKTDVLGSVFWSTMMTRLSISTTIALMPLLLFPAF